MNTELKAIITVILDIYLVGKKLTARENLVTSVMPALSQLLIDIPSVILNFSGLKAEIDALPGSAQEKDLIDFIQNKMNGLVCDEKAKAILNIVSKLIVQMGEGAILLTHQIKA